MVAAGWSPSVRLFEAACCGVPILSDDWPGLTELFRPGVEILTVETAEDVLGHLHGCGEERRTAMAQAARARVLGAHTAAARAEELERYLREAAQGEPRLRRAAEG
jgi:spore maturation protein CgeB